MPDAAWLGPALFLARACALRGAYRPAIADSKLAPTDLERASPGQIGGGSEIPVPDAAWLGPALFPVRACALRGAYRPAIGDSNPAPTDFERASPG